MGAFSTAVAQESDDSAMRPSFSVEYTSELQTDFEHSRMGNLLQLGAEVPLSGALSLNVSTVSFAATSAAPLANDLMGYSNIDADNIALALAVVGATWRVSDSHTVFAGIRSMDEDYFCSDVLSLFTNSPCGGFPTITANFDMAAYPMAAIGLHYAYNREDLTLQASLYNGAGHYRFAGRDNVFRVCPGSDGVFALAQMEYRVGDSHYYLGGSAHHSDMNSTADKKLRPVAWAYAEQSLTERLTLIVAYSHAFSSDNACRDFFAIGGKLTIGKAELGLFADHTKIDGISEWATELTCNYALTDHLSLQPVLHIIDTDSHAKCIGMLRLGVSL